MPVKKVVPKKEVKKVVKVSAKKVTKPVVAKVVKPSTASVVKPQVVKKAKSSTKTVVLSVPVYSLLGKQNGEMVLPKEIFGSFVNKVLLSQALRVYITNRKQLLGHTKTRGNVKASKAKIYRQKGTGKARHGAITAPIFVGGGIAFGPQSRKVRLDLPKSMRKAALISALSSKLVDKSVAGLSGIEKANGKTKEMFNLLTKISDGKKIRSTLIVTGARTEGVLRSVKNIPGVDTLSTNLLNAYEVLSHEMLLVTKDALEAFSKTPVKSEQGEQK